MQTPSNSRDEAPNLLARRIEEASLNAWPALQQIFLDGWILRFARGFTKRSNSVVPLYPPVQKNNSDAESAQEHLISKIRYCENLYAKERLQTVFRLTSIVEDFPGGFQLDRTLLDRTLAQRGYSLEETSLVMSTVINDAAPSAHERSDPVFVTLEEWLKAYAALTGLPEPAKSLHSIILKSISGESGLAVIYQHNAPMACGLAVLENDLVGLFDIYTADHARQQGFGTAIVQALQKWAHERGAKHTYLQVAANNASATSLYTTLGFTEIYRYWYRLGQ